jgi:hypothetical protein
MRRIRGLRSLSIGGTPTIALVVAACCCFIKPTAASAQRIAGMRAGVARTVGDSMTGDGISSDSVASVLMPPRINSFRAHLPAKRYAAIVSAIVPGGGQFILGNDRFIAYAAVEFLTWLKYAKDVHEKSTSEASFRDIARRVARANFSMVTPDGDWTYYEAMRDYLESGNYSLSDTRLIPETDVTTFNGYTWQVAQNTMPDSSAQLAYYKAHAAGPDFRWSWRNAQLQFDQFKRTTENRNDAARAMTRDLTIIGLNHVLSVVDAFATFRLEVRPQVNGRTSVGASVPW